MSLQEAQSGQLDRFQVKFKTIMDQISELVESSADLGIERHPQFHQIQRALLGPIGRAGQRSEGQANSQHLNTSQQTDNGDILANNGECYVC